ncbi:MAG TPA: helix-turn-helix transcriptional regulator [Bacilli bacterium]|nr:helix-turn-helix transcriptional regulator [Bacilli bacterium]
MGLSYNKLWKLLIDKGINRNDLHELTGIGQSTIVKLSKGENVNTEVLARICKALNCNIDDIVEYTEEDKK